MKQALLKNDEMNPPVPLAIQTGLRAGVTVGGKGAAGGGTTIGASHGDEPGTAHGPTSTLPKPTWLNP